MFVIAIGTNRSAPTPASAPAVQKASPAPAPVMQKASPEAQAALYEMLGSKKIHLFTHVSFKWPDHPEFQVDRYVWDQVPLDTKRDILAIITANYKNFDVVDDRSGRQLASGDSWSGPSIK